MNPARRRGGRRARASARGERAAGTARREPRRPNGLRAASTRESSPTRFGGADSDGNRKGRGECARDRKGGPSRGRARPVERGERLRALAPRAPFAAARWTQKEGGRALARLWDVEHAGGRAGAPPGRSAARRKRCGRHDAASFAARALLRRRRRAPRAWRTWTRGEAVDAPARAGGTRRRAARCATPPRAAARADERRPARGGRPRGRPRAPRRPTAWPPRGDPRRGGRRRRACHARDGAHEGEAQVASAPRG